MASELVGTVVEVVVPQISATRGDEDSASAGAGRVRVRGETGIYMIISSCITSCDSILNSLPKRTVPAGRNFERTNAVDHE